MEISYKQPKSAPDIAISIAIAIVELTEDGRETRLTNIKNRPLMTLP